MKVLRTIFALLLMVLPCAAQYGSGQGSYGTIGLGGSSGTGSTNTTAGFGSLTNVIYVDSVNGKPVNSGFGPGTNQAIDSINTLINSNINYANSPIKFVGGVGTTYFVPANQPLILSNNVVDLAGVTISANVGDNPPDTTTNGTIVFRGSNDMVLNGTIIANSTNQNQWPIIFDSANNPSNAQYIVRNCSIYGITDVAGCNVGQGSSGKRFTVLFDNDYGFSYWDGPTFAQTLTTDQTNSDFVIKNSVIDIEADPNATGHTNLATLSVAHGIYVNGGTLTSLGNLIRVNGAATNDYGIYIAESRSKGYSNWIASTVLDVRTNTSFSSTAVGIQVNNAIPPPVMILGHPYRDSDINNTARVYFTGDATNGTTLQNAVMQADSSGNRYWTQSPNIPTNTATTVTNTGNVGIGGNLFSTTNLAPYSSLSNFVITTNAYYTNGTSQRVFTRAAITYNIGNSGAGAAAVNLNLSNSINGTVEWIGNVGQTITAIGTGDTNTIFCSQSFVMGPNDWFIFQCSVAGSASSVTGGKCIMDGN